jgi:hypothetical protein
MSEIAKVEAMKPIEVMNVENNNYKDDANWEHYNYPKFLKIVHFDLEEINEEDLRKLVLRIQVVFILIATVSCVNSISYN